MATTPKTPAFGKPSITTPRQFDLRTIQQAIDNIRERFQVDERGLSDLYALVAGSKAVQDVAQLQKQVKALNDKVAALNTAPDVAELASLLSQGNGIVILKDGHLLTRVLVPGQGILITWPDGAGGDPIISTGNILAQPLAQSAEWDFGAEGGFDEGVVE